MGSRRQWQGRLGGDSLACRRRDGPRAGELAGVRIGGESQSSTGVGSPRTSRDGRAREWAYGRERDCLASAEVAVVYAIEVQDPQFGVTNRVTFVVSAALGDASRQ